MRLLGFFLLPAGWLITLAAFALLKTTASQGAFVAAGMGVEGIGLTLIFRSYLHRGKK